MFVATDKPAPAESGLGALVLLLRFHGIGADPEQIRHRFGADIGVPEMLRCAKEFGLKARSYQSTGAPGEDAAARHRSVARRRLSASRQGRRRSGSRSEPDVAATHR